MPQIAVITEGRYDKALAFLIKRIKSSYRIKILTCGGKSRVLSKGPGLIKSIATDRQDCNHFIICRDTDDSDRRNICDLNALFVKVFKQNGVVIDGVRIKLVFPINEFESWLLADEVNLTNYLKTRIEPYSSPETIPNPKEALRAVFSKAGKRLIEFDDYMDLAESVNLETIASKCSSFRRLQQYLSIIPN